MNRIVRIRGARAVANFLIVAILAPAFGFMGSGVALGQYNRMARQLTVVVYNITDVSIEVKVDDLAALARDALWNEMQQNRWFQPVPPRDVQAELERSKLSLPLSEGEQVQLAGLLNADVVASGYVQAVKVGGDPRQAQVTLQVFLLDRLSGEYINGATATESSDPMPGYEGPDSALVSEALKKAANSAVETIGRYEVPEGFIITSGTERDIRISLGEREGVEPGDKFVVIGRTTDSAADPATQQTFPQKQGVIQVSETRPTYSLCKRVEGGRGFPIQVGDFVRGLYYERPLAEGMKIKEPGGRESKSRKNLPKVIGVLVLLILFGILIESNGAHASPGIGVRAQSVNIPGLPNAMTRVHWDPSRQIPLAPVQRAGYVVGYEVHRGTTPEFPITPNSMIMFVEGGQQVQFDDDSTGGATPWLVTITTDGDTGIVTVTYDAGSGTPNWDFAGDTITYDYVQTPPQIGRTYYYAIRVVSKKLGAQPFDPTGGTTGGGTTTIDFAGTLTPSVATRCGPVMTIEPPVLQFPPDRPDPGSTDVNLDTVQFEWSRVAGADTYVIEVSTDRAFPANHTVRGSAIFASGTSITMSGRLTGVGGSPSTLFRNWAGPLYWRVGAKYSLDQFPPIDGRGNAVEYVFSTPRSFEALELPPAGP